MLIEPNQMIILIIVAILYLTLSPEISTDVGSHVSWFFLP